jgi:RNA ligase (TIGR02306 family)
MSSHKCEVVPIKLEPHPNADALSIVRVGGYTVVARTADWQGIEKAVYVPPDSLIDPNKPDFAFLANKDNPTAKVHIKARKLRGVISMGLLVPAPSDAQIGDDYAEKMGIEHYEHVVNEQANEVAGPPWFNYDIESLRKYNTLFTKGEPVFVTEKLDGENIKMVCHDGQIYVGSRTIWKGNTGGDRFWEAFKRQPELERYIRYNPDVLLRGELYGGIKKFPYDTKGTPKIRLFDIETCEGYLDSARFIQHCQKNNLPIVPIVGCGVPFDMAELENRANGISAIGNHIREGIVVKPMLERRDDLLGRCILKLHGSDYLTS